MNSSPIAIIGFNRPDLIEKQIQILSLIKPELLIFILDGPREGNTDDINALDKIKKSINTIDWDCMIIRDYSDHNLGCKERIISGLNSLFDQFDDAIILEDDCVPSIDFFEFCTYAINKYRNDSLCMHISGSRPYSINIKDSYYYSRLPRIWGWATWKRAWEKYDVNMTQWNHSYLDEYFILSKYTKSPLIDILMRANVFGFVYNF